MGSLDTRRRTAPCRLLSTKSPSVVLLSINIQNNTFVCTVVILLQQKCNWGFFFIYSTVQKFEPSLIYLYAAGKMATYIDSHSSVDTVSDESSVKKSKVHL